MADNLETKVAKLVKYGNEKFGLSETTLRGVIDNASVGSSGSSKLPQVIDRSITELSAEDFGDVTTVGSYAFSGCSELTKVVLPEKITALGDYCFRDCKKLSSINLPQSLKTIGLNVLYNCNLSGVIDIPESVTSIGQYAFFNNLGIEEINIGKNVKTIIDNTFQVDKAGSKLNYINVNSENTMFDSRNNCNCLIRITDNQLLRGSANGTIPEGVVSISGGAFRGLDNLKKIEIPSSVTTYYSSYHFADCVNLETVVIKNKAQIKNDMFYRSNSIKLYDFSDCTEVVPLGNTRALGHASGCIIRIPASLYDTWTTATNWSALTDVVWEKYPAEEQPTLITFYINNDTSGSSGSTEYQAESGMTLEQWVNSKYNTDGWVLVEDTLNGYYVVKSADEINSIGELETEDNAGSIALEGIPATTVITSYGTYKLAMM